MIEVLQLIKQTGNISLDTFWFPLLIWTACCSLAFLALRYREDINPLFQYHLRAAALFSLPVGIIISMLVQKIPQWYSSEPIETAFFIVQNPINALPAAGTSLPDILSFNWMDPSFIIGLISLAFALVSTGMLIQLLISFRSLKKLQQNLNMKDLEEDSALNGLNKQIRVAFHSHPLVPFTFGWKNPVIVMPEVLQHEPEKMDMAIRHELIHIKRGDYLLQLVLSVIESVFWFHPLVRYGNREIDTYREISCDQEVLARSEFSVKSYANLLYELLPLNTGLGRLSVSMAVKDSTLKKRIRKMKYHKLHRASFRQSLFFLFLMILGITLPIACSDLRGPQGLSAAELENMELTISGFAVEINGQEIINSDRGVGATPKGTMAFFMNAGEYGLFKISPIQFEGGLKAGSIDGRTIHFDINQLNIVLKSSENILPGGKSTPVWIEHNTDIDTNIGHGVMSAFESIEAFTNKNKIAQVSESKLKTNSEEDIFVVVEQMPRLIGGMASIHSKIKYSELARRAGIEGRVTVQFVVNEQGNVEDAEVVRGIGGGLDEEALRVVKEAKFEPGIQRGRPVSVQYAMSVNYRLEDSAFSSKTGSETAGD